MSVSVVLTLERTLLFHASRVACLTEERLLSAGISELTLLQAWDVEMKDTPTLDLTLSVSNVKMAPRRWVLDSRVVLLL